MMLLNRLIEKNTKHTWNEDITCQSLSYDASKIIFTQNLILKPIRNGIPQTQDLRNQTIQSKSQVLLCLIFTLSHLSQVFLFLTPHFSFSHPSLLHPNWSHPRKSRKFIILHTVRGGGANGYWFEMFCFNTLRANTMSKWKRNFITWYKNVSKSPSLF